ncbi:MAG TPA: crossover junction endodeoxyribonuclease RuvC [Nitrospirae bacterium]|nr:crossover junction endodeoxyribonuclease RuvC [bacterium BMS3Abin06]HDH12124.1 crossover junction endodeoxyribonuclease RuvC [Nitrospirota bacterium]HDZ02370.1 crossover junction endodeoxyribonuclease RuvC [Nitrospirota bacterium]
MRIIGIDPGTICCGYGILETGVRRSELTYITAGDIRLNKKAPLSERLRIVYDSLTAVINENNPSHLCLEKIFYHKSIRSALALGSVRGVALLLAAQTGIPVFEYNSTELKMALTGYGRAEKRQVQEMVKILLNLKSSTLGVDSTDALALCICHINSSFKLK